MCDFILREQSNRMCKFFIENPKKYKKHLKELKKKIQQNIWNMKLRYGDDYGKRSFNQ